MVGEFIYFAKLLGLTVVAVLLMQVRVGNRSVEAHALNWLETSCLVGPLNVVARGGGRLLKDATRRFRPRQKQVETVPLRPTASERRRYRWTESKRERDESEVDTD